MEAPAGPAFRMTPQRRAVLDAVQGARDHPTAEQIHRAVATTSPGIGMATVYRTLDLLVQHGQVCELRLGAQAVSRYESNATRHDHVVCRSCGAIRDIDVALPVAVLASAEHQGDVTIDAYDLEFHGTCAACRGTR